MGAEQIHTKNIVIQDRGLSPAAHDVPSRHIPLSSTDLVDPTELGDERLVAFSQNLALSARLLGRSPERTLQAMGVYLSSTPSNRTTLEQDVDRNLSMGTVVRFKRVDERAALKTRDGNLPDADLLKFRNRFAGYNGNYDKKVNLIEELESYDRGLAVTNFELYLAMWYELRQGHPTAQRRSRDLLARFNASGPADQEQEAITILGAVDKIMDRRYRNGIEELDEVVRDRIEGKIENKRIGEPSIVDENIFSIGDVEAQRRRISLQIDSAADLKTRYERGSRPQRLDIVETLPGEIEKAYIEAFGIYAKAWDELNRGGGDIADGWNQRFDTEADITRRAEMSKQLRRVVSEELSRRFGHYRDIVKDTPHGVMKVKDSQERFGESSIPGKIEFLKDLGVV